MRNLVNGWLSDAYGIDMLIQRDGLELVFWKKKNTQKGAVFHNVFWFCYFEPQYTFISITYTCGPRIYDNFNKIQLCLAWFYETNRRIYNILEVFSRLWKYCFFIVLKEKGYSKTFPPSALFSSFLLCKHFGISI